MIQPLIYRFGVEEVFLIQRALRLDDLPGIHDQIFARLDEDHQALALAVADRSLRARGHLHNLGHANREIDAQVVGTFTEYACAETYCVVDIQTSTASLAIQYAIAPQFAVEHLESDAGVHQFTVAYAMDEMLDYIERYLPMTALAGNGDMATVSQLVPNESSSSLLQALIAGEQLPTALAGNLRNALAQPTQLTTVTVNHRSQTQGTLLVLLSGGRLYCAEIKDNRIVIGPAEGMSLHQRLADLLQPWLKAS